MDWEQVVIHHFVPPPRGMGAAMSFWTNSVVSALSSRPATVSCGARGLDHVHWQAFCRWGFLSFTRYAVKVIGICWKQSEVPPNSALDNEL